MVCETKIKFKKKRKSECKMTRFDIQVDISDEDIERMYINNDKISFEEIVHENDANKLVFLGLLLGSIETTKEILGKYTPIVYDGTKH